MFAAEISAAVIRLFDAYIYTERGLLDRRRMLLANRSAGCIRPLVKGSPETNAPGDKGVYNTLSRMCNRRDQRSFRVMRAQFCRGNRTVPFPLENRGTEFTELHKSISLFSDSKILKRAS